MVVVGERQTKVGDCQGLAEDYHKFEFKLFKNLNLS